MIIKVKNVEKEKLDKFQVLMQDEAFAREVIECTDPKEVKAKMAARGLTLEDSELNELAAALNNAMKSSGELKVEDLDDVSGGGVFTLADISWKAYGVTWTIHIPW